MYGLVRAPEIDREGLTWFNVPRPLSLRDLRGRIVILDFWTYCCIRFKRYFSPLRFNGLRSAKGAFDLRPVYKSGHLPASSEF